MTCNGSTKMKIKPVSVTIQADDYQWVKILDFYSIGATFSAALDTKGQKNALPREYYITTEGCNNVHQKKSMNIMNSVYSFLDAIAKNPTEVPGEDEANKLFPVKMGELFKYTQIYRLDATYQGNEFAFLFTTPCDSLNLIITKRAFPKAGIVIKKFCAGIQQWAIYTDGEGGTYRQMIDHKSKDCGWVKRGVLMSKECRGTQQWATYHDGEGGSYKEIYNEKSEECGWIKPGVKLDELCIGFDLYYKYSDGEGGSTNTLVAENSRDCGYIPPTTPPPTTAPPTTAPPTTPPPGTTRPPGTTYRPPITTSAGSVFCSASQLYEVTSVVELAADPRPGYGTWFKVLGVFKPPSSSTPIFNAVSFPQNDITAGPKSVWCTNSSVPKTTLTGLWGYTHYYTDNTYGGSAGDSSSFNTAMIKTILGTEGLVPGATNSLSIKDYRNAYVTGSGSFQFEVAVYNSNTATQPPTTPPPSGPANVRLFHTGAGGWQPVPPSMTIGDDGFNGELAVIVEGLNIPAGTPLIVLFTVTDGSRIWLDSQFTGWSGNYSWFGADGYPANVFYMTRHQGPLVTGTPAEDVSHVIGNSSMGGTSWGIRFRYAAGGVRMYPDQDLSGNVMITIHHRDAPSAEVARATTTYRFRSRNTKMDITP